MHHWAEMADEVNGSDKPSGKPTSKKRLKKGAGEAGEKKEKTKRSNESGPTKLKDFKADFYRIPTLEFVQSAKRNNFTDWKKMEIVMNAATKLYGGAQVPISEGPNAAVAVASTSRSELVEDIDSD